MTSTKTAMTQAHNTPEDMEPENTENEASAVDAQNDPEALASQMADDAIALDGFADPRELEALREENAKLKDQALRALAEAENARRRAAIDKEDAAKFSINSFAKDLLPVADNFRRALDSVSAEARDADPQMQNLLSGIEATERELLRSLERHGVEQIDAMNKSFDPNLHEVMFEMPSGGQPAGTVLQVVEAGYVLKGRILRPARVGIAADEGQGGSEPGHSVDTQA